MRTEGVVLVARRAEEYWFVDSVFWHGADLFGCTGSTVYPISKDQADDALSSGMMEDKFEACWAECATGNISGDCEKCAFGPIASGCEDCGYPSLYDFCTEIAQNHGYDAVFDNPGYEYEEALRELLVSDDDPDCVETVDHSSCGRIFGRACPDYFDEVYNPAALEACLAYEKGIISYDCAVQVIFGKSED